jgi:hypothetical protein
VIEALLIAGVLALLAVLLLRPPQSSTAASPADDQALCRAFALDPQRYRVLGADVGGYPRKFYIRADGLIGCPDAVFLSHDDLEIVCGEVKARHHRSAMTDYERFQMVLYQGTLAAMHPGRRIRGLVRYRDRVTEAQFCPKTYRRLLGLRAECRQARSSATDCADKRTLNG